MKTKNNIHSLIFLILSFCFTQSNAFTQESKRAFGLRMGGYAAYNALDYKEYLSPNFAIETVLGKNKSSTDQNTSLQILFQFQNRVGGAGSKLSWYTGGGPAVMYWYSGSGYVNGRTLYASALPKFRGMVNTIVGLECTIGNLPLNAAIDLGPSFTVYPYFQINFMVNASFRFTIKNDKLMVRHKSGRNGRHF